MKKTKDDILVSISCITYNHGLYIRECIDGFLMQKTDFRFEILIHDDASTDDTAKIIKEYENKYPDLIKPIYQTENQYSKRNGSISAQFNYPRAKGKYIAVCEGDDFWTNPEKLQKQVDFLEKNLEYNVCGGYCDVFKNNKIISLSPINIKFKTYNLYDQIYGNSIFTLTILYRKDILNKYKINHSDYRVGDLPLLCYLTKEGGRIGKLPYVFGVYRNHSGGIWSGSSIINQYKVQFHTKHKLSIDLKNFKFKIKLKLYFFNTAFREFKNVVLGHPSDIRIVLLSLNYLFKI